MTRRSCIIPSCAILLALLSLSAPSDAAPLYTVTNIGTLGGTSSSANDINNQGHVVGGSVTADGASHAFLFQNGAIQDLGTPSMIPSVNARGINDAGDILVNGTSADNQSVQRIFRWRNGNYDDLGTLIGGSEITGSSIANNDYITGSGNAIEGPQRAFVRHNGFYNTLPTLGGFGSVGQSINSLGHTVGYSGAASGNNHAFLYTGPTGPGVTVTPLQDLGTLGGAISQANTINERDQIAGQSGINPQDTTHAFLYQNGRMSDLGTLTNARTGANSSSFANDINNLGDIVGYVQATGGTTPFTAFLYTSGQMTDLNTLIPENSGWSLWFAAALNDKGQVVGSGTFNGEPRAFLLTPNGGSSTPPPTAIPLPSAFIPAAVLLGLLGQRKLRMLSMS